MFLYNMYRVVREDSPLFLAQAQDQLKPKATSIVIQGHKKLQVNHLHGQPAVHLKYLSLK